MTQFCSTLRQLLRGKFIMFKKEAISALFLGLFIGLIIGLSISSIIGIVIAGMISLLASFFGLKEGTANGKTKTEIISLFSAFAIIGVICGIYLRTHGSLSLSLKEKKEKWVAAGFSEEQAKTIVLFEELRIIRDSSFVPATKEFENTNIDDTGLMAEHFEQNIFCRDQQYNSVGELKKVFKQAGPHEIKFVSVIEVEFEDSSFQRKVLESYQKAICP